MKGSFFSAILKNIAVPIVAILILRDSFLGFKGSFLAVTIALTVVNIFSIAEHAIVIMPNLVLLKTHRILRILIKALIEFFSVIGFWLYFFTQL
jgi:hypothetical protein